MRKLRNTGLLKHTRDIGNCLRRHFLCRHDVAKQPAHVRNLALPALYAQRLIDFLLTGSGFVWELIGVKPALRQEPPDYK